MTLAALGIVVTVSLAKLLAASEAKYEWAQKANKGWFSFTFLGKPFDATDILTLECLGFIIGITSWFAYRAYVPRAIDPGGSSARDSLAESIRKSGSEIPGRDLLFTLNALRDTASQKDEWKEFDWKHVDSSIQKLNRELRDVRATPDNAAKVIEVFPPDEELLKSFGKDLFNITRPTWRVLLFGALTVAFILTGLPILVRTLLLFFKILEKEPSKWWI